MEGSIASRARLPRATQMAVATLDTNPRMRRPPREPVQPPSPFHQLVVTLATGKWLLLAVALLGGILAGLAGFTRPVLFEATTQIIIDAPSTGTSNATATAQDSLDSSIDDHLTMLSSQAHLRRVLAALRQPQAADIAAKSGISAVPPTGSSFVGNLLNGVLYALVLFACLEAFGTSLNFWTVLALNILVGTIASLIPVPGGGTAVGSVGMTGALTAVGVPTEVAVAAVLANQLVANFIPAFPGWFATSDLIDHDYM